MRLIILLLSMSSVALYGYAVAGLAGFLVGRGRLDYIFHGLFFGTAAAATSLLLWKRWISLLESEMAELQKREEQSAPPKL